MAGADSSQGDHERALAQLETALKIGPEVWGTNHPDLRDTKSNYAAALYAAHRLEDAVKVNQELYTERYQHDGERHPDTLRTLNNLCTGLLQLRQFDTAEPWVNKLLVATLAVRGEDHLSTARVLGMQIEVLAHRVGGLEGAGRDQIIEQCMQEYQRVLTTYDQRLGSKHPDTIIARNNFGVFCLKHAQQPAKAVPILRRVISDWEAAMPTATAPLRVFRMSLAKALVGAGRETEAEAEFLRAWPLPSHPLATDAMVSKRLARLYTHLGKPDQAAKWRAREH